MQDELTNESHGGADLGFFLAPVGQSQEASLHHIFAYQSASLGNVGRRRCLSLDRLRNFV